MTNTPEQRDKRGKFVTTYSGARFFIDECNLEDIPMFDIAHALSMNCRFNGHLASHYSVAEHSIVVSYLVPKEHALTGLLHDISEAFIPDIPRPFKSQIGGFDAYEDKIMEAVHRVYGISYPFPDEVRYIDKNIVRDEAEMLYPSPPSWTKFYDTVYAGRLIRPYNQQDARTAFMQRFAKLMYERDDDSHS